MLKTQIVLFMYHKLVTKGSFTYGEVLYETGISERSFYRYIAEIHAFLSNFYIEKQLEFNPIEHCYYLKEK